ncbi:MULTISPECIES: AarF/ABC1/UbiB kinase family protein [unclassified Synechococcus]|uniref:ABC1 kinase family protein n=1 Tax=unclassified Synechococcus TaxID=2626047 RepID=UPI001F0B479D|nr:MULTISPECIES: AarF/ABC1/UbiB kinase family protein [unclassified Synechococcus]
MGSEPAKPYTAYRWARENYTRWGRLIDIWRFVLTWLFYLWLDQQAWSYGGQPTAERKAKRRRARAIWIRETLLHLGPTFIKVGQFFSTRADLFPSEYVEELSKLQDRVPAFGYEQVAAIVQQELGKPIEQIYSYFDPTPLAAASLGQVHRAKLKTGEEVVVKVQRPGLTRLFTIDLEICRGIAEFFQYHTRWGGPGRDWIGIYGECRRTLWEEVDYLNEGRNADTFRRNFRDMPQIAVPKVYWRYTSPRLLTLEYLPGIKISDYEALSAAGLDRKLLARLGAEAYLRQLLKDGFFHADPHPGNIAVKPDGTLIFYDFGMMGRIRPGIKEKLVAMLAAVVAKNADLVVASLVELGVLVPTADLAPVRRSVQYMLDHFMDKPFSNSSDEISVMAISEDLYELAYDQPFRFPATFTFVMRALTTLEGLGKSLDPEFNFLEVAKPFAEELMNGSKPETETLLAQVSRQAAEFTSSSLSLPRRLEATLSKLEQGELRLRVRSSEAERLLRKLNSTGRGVIYAVLFATFFLSATQLFSAGHATLAIVTLALAVLAALALVRVLLKANGSEPLM